MSAAAKTFDPLGLVSPWLVRYRLLTQDAWCMQSGLDDPLPASLVAQALALQEEASAMGGISFPRHLPVPVDAHLESYADASSQVYAACVYLAVGIDRRLIFSRYRVAPLHKQKLTIPRLELMAALLTARAVSYLRRARDDLRDLCCSYFSDSTVTLGWIRGEPSDVFLRNRVREIRRLSPRHAWSHVPTEENPADLITRGMTAQALKRSDKWWKGPSSGFRPPPAVTPAICALKASPAGPCLPIVRWSSWERARRVIAWALRFLNNCRVRRCKRQVGPISAAEVQSAEFALIKDAQAGIEVEECDPRLHLERREDDVIVGRLRSGESALPFLPRRSNLVPLLIRHAHGELHHQGPSATSAELARSYLIPRIKRTAKAILASCVRCRRMTSRPFHSEEGALPDFRTTPARPFEKTGIDHFGPLLVGEETKVWILLFTCAVVRAVHMEVVTSLSEEETALAIRRFQAVRGPLKEIYSDNGRAFVALQHSWKDRLTWRTIPVRSPWWGGWWERVIGTVKRALKATLSHSHLNLPELQTIVAECAERVNRRPITPDSEDAEEPLTPAHFLYGCTPPPLLGRAAAPDSGEALGRRWRHRQCVLSHLWERWRAEYLTSLRGWRRTPRREARLPEVGDVVLCSSRPLPRGRWPLARITELVRGRDGEVRSAVVRIGNRTSRRALSLLHPLEGAPHSSAQA